MELLKPLSNAFQCPTCNGFDGFSYSVLQAECKKCHAAFDVFDLFDILLTKMNDSELWSFPFAIISQFRLAPVCQAILNDESIRFRPYEPVTLDFRQRGLPKDARLLYVNISPYSRGNLPPVTLGFAYLGGNARRSISDLSHTIRIVPVPPPHSTDDWSDPDQYLLAAIMVRWYEEGIHDVVSDQLVRAAEGYWKDDLPDMIYYGFTAFEISLSNLVDDFWQSGFRLNEKEYESLLGKDSADKRMRVHLPLLCRVLGLPFSDEVRNRFNILHELRKQRNAVVHDGQLDGELLYPKGKLFAALCWGLLFLKELRSRLPPAVQTNKF